MRIKWDQTWHLESTQASPLIKMLSLIFLDILNLYLYYINSIIYITENFSTVTWMNAETNLKLLLNLCNFNAMPFYKKLFFNNEALNLKILYYKGGIWWFYLVHKLKDNLKEKGTWQWCVKHWLSLVSPFL